MQHDVRDRVPYRYDIDLLRAFAVVAVVLYHISTRLLPGGFVGVDIFFVISGYLITGQLEQALQQNRFSFLDFYTRRFRRLYPALILVLVVTTLCAVFILTPGAQNQFGRELRAVATISVNYYFLGLENDYFGMMADHRPLLHMWSLSVEEQFYLIWPVLLWTLQRLLHGRNERLRLASDILVFLIFGFSLFWCLYSSYHDSSQAFYGMPSRAWEFAGGGILALNQRGWAERDRLGTILRWMGLGVLLVSVVWIDGHDLFPGYVVLAPVLGSLLFLAGGYFNPRVVGSGTIWGRAVRHTGRISYSFYLWHWVLLAMVRSWYLERYVPRDILMGGVLSYALAHLTYVFVEQPLRWGTTPWSCLNHLRFRHGLYAMLFLYMLGNLEIFYPVAPTLAQRQAARWSVDPVTMPSGCHLASSGIPLASVDACSLGHPSDPVRVLVWGDSHAGRLLPVLKRYSQNYPVRILVRISNGCVPIAGVIPAGDHSYRLHCLRFADAVNQQIGRLHQRGVRGVLLDARWLWYLVDGKPFDLGLLRPAESVHLLNTGTGLLNPSHARQVLADGLRQQLASIRHQGLRIILVLPEPEVPYSAPECLARLPVVRCNELRNRFEQNRRDVVSLFRNLVAGDPNIRLLDTTSQFCDARWCYARKNGIINFVDDNHMSTARAIASQPLYDAALSWLDQDQ